MDALTRRELIALGALGAAAGLTGCVGRGGEATASSVSWPSAVGLSPFGRPVPIAAGPPQRGAAPPGTAAPGPETRSGGGPRLVAGTRVVADAGAGTHAITAAVNAEEQWLRTGIIPGEGGPFGEMARLALLDLRVMLRPHGALVDGWGSRGGTVEPRAAALGATALALCGHQDEALDVLEFLAIVQQTDGSFFDRYPPGQRGPDPPSKARARVPRVENCGWVLWSADQILRDFSWRRRRRVFPGLRSLVVRSFTRIMSSLDVDGLPEGNAGRRPGWEDPVALAVAAPQLAGLSAAVELEQRGGARVQTFALADAVLRLDSAITRAFGPDYPASRGSGHPDPDITFLLPPFVADTDPGRRAAARLARRGLRRPVGLLIPGRTWVSTVHVAQFALADAYTPGDELAGDEWAGALAGGLTGDDPAGVDAGPPLARSVGSLAWLDAHRTRLGSLPAAVRFDGSPAGPAPSVTTAALVLLTLARIHGTDG